MVPITHQDIADRIRALDQEELALNQRSAKERESLAELCGGLGHTFDVPRQTWSFETGPPTVRRSGLTHECKVCRFSDWVGEPITEGA
jgi:hypothetical protein